MTRPRPLGRPVSCARCGARFTRAHGRQKLCPACTPPWVRARSAARRAARPDRLAVTAQAVRHPSVAAAAAARWHEVLGSRCPHGAALGECPWPWCRNRAADFERRGGYLPAKLSGTPGEPGGRFTVDGAVVAVARVTRAGLVLDARRMAVP